MKAVPTKIHFVQVALTTLASAFAVLAAIFAGNNIIFTPAVWGYVNPGANQSPVILGVISGFHLLSFISFLFTYLAFEFYAIKNGLYVLFTSCLIMCGMTALFFYLQKISVTAPGIYFDTALVAFFLPNKHVFAVDVFSYFIGALATLILAAGIRKITRGYFMFFRFTLAALAGFAIRLATSAYFLHEGFTWDTSGVIQLITPAAQSVILILASVVPLHVLRLLFFFFRGRVKVSTDVVKSDPIAPPVNQPELTVDDLLLQPVSQTKPPMPQPEDTSEKI